MRYALKSQLRKVKQTPWALPLAIMLVLSVPVRGNPLSYTLTVVAKTGDTIDGKTLTGFKLPSFGANPPAINASGRVAFYATYSEGAFVGEGIFTSTSLVLKTGDAVNGQTLEGISFVPAISDNGTVIVHGLLSSQKLAVLSSTTLLAESGDVIGGQKLTSIGVPAVNNKGAVAFVGSFSGGTGIFTQTALLAKSSEAIAGQELASFGPPVINDQGMVAFQGWLSGDAGTAIFTPAAPLVKVGDTICGRRLTDLFFGRALNASGTVAFVGVFPGGTGVFTQKDLLLQAGDTIGGQTLTTFGYPVINDAGIVAFFATYEGGAGIFTQSSLIAKTGDMIAGKTLTDLGQPVINRSGAVVFAGLFSDGSSAIMLARPILGSAESRTSCSPHE